MVSDSSFEGRVLGASLYAPFSLGLGDAQQDNWEKELEEALQV